MTHQRNTSLHIIAALLVLALCHLLSAAELQRDYTVKPVPFNHVHVDDGFWTPRLETNRKVTIPYAFQKCEETGRIRNFEKAAGLMDGDHEGIYFNDSDVYKVMEGAAYSLQVYPDALMRMYLDKLITIMGAAQWDDGYLYTFYSVPEKQPGMRWTDIQSKHEQYCMGHMYEAAVAHYQVTGDKTFLDIATKSADLICDVFNPENRTDPPGHQEIEVGLCRLYRATGDEKYLNEAKFFLDQRGRIGHRGPDGKGKLYGPYAQDHKPVTEQTKALGHSVRAAYLYTGMADVAALTGDASYIHAIDAIWSDVVDTKLYVTGGIGADGGHEGFGDPYKLANMTAYCETCASIANVLWNHRMFLMHNDAKYIDVLERTLYNATLSGISMTGDRFFYPNVLESTGQHERSPWFGCACCPSNVARFVASVPGMVYAHKDSDIYVNLFVGSETSIQTDTNKVTLVQETDYPWKGQVKVTVEPEESQTFAVCVRIPGWARNEPVPSDLYRFHESSKAEPTLKVNGRKVPLEITKGFARVERRWAEGDTIVLDLPMAIRRVIAHEAIEADRGRVALQRGPLVYCLEWPDNEARVQSVIIPDNAKLKAKHQSDLLNGVTVITGQAQIAKRNADGSVVAGGHERFTAIPYYAWAHRGRGPMIVWPARTIDAADPGPAETLAYTSKLTASFVHASLEAITDQVLPPNSGDNSKGQLDFWPHNGTTEWLQFSWDRPQKLSRVKVYWFDDSGHGGCKLPKSWKALYRDASGDFKPVENSGPYGIEKDGFNTVEFTPVETKALKIEIVLNEKWSAGIQEVEIE